MFLYYCGFVKCLGFILIFLFLDFIFWLYLFFYKYKKLLYIFFNSFKLDGWGDFIKGLLLGYVVLVFKGEGFVKLLFFD